MQVTERKGAEGQEMQAHRHEERLVCVGVGTHTGVQVGAMFPVVKIPGSEISRT